MENLQDFLISCLTKLTDVRYTQVSALTIITWDYFNLLQDEIEFFWGPRNWSPARILFFLNRYWTIGYAVLNTFGLFGTTNSDVFCNVWLKYMVEAGGLCSAAWIDLIQALRIYGLYGARRTVMIPLMVLWFVANVAAATIASMSLRNGGGTAHPVPAFPSISVCAPIGETMFVWAVWIPLLVYELVAFVLAAHITFQHLRDGWIGSEVYKVVTIMQQDSTLYFAVILVGYLFSVLWLRLAALELVFVPVGTLNAIMAAMASRMLIHIRKQASLKTSYSMGSSLVIEMNCSQTKEHTFDEEDDITNTRSQAASSS